MYHGPRPPPNVYLHAPVMATVIFSETAWLTTMRGALCADSRRNLLLLLAALRARPWNPDEVLLQQTRKVGAAWASLLAAAARWTPILLC